MQQLLWMNATLDFILFALPSYEVREGSEQVKMKMK